ncbi:MAG: T9SS type A sorting domain-containing protein [Bacteroidia bacterium]
MNTKLRFFVALVCLVCALPLSAQRYLTEVFAAFDSTSDVPYAVNISVLTGSPASTTLRMDVYEPMGDNLTKRPLIIMSHTGSFLPPVINGQPTGSRKDSTVVEMAKQFAKRGYVCAIMSNRLGWNPTSSDQDVRTGTLLGAAYRGIQDFRACVRYFKMTAATMNNPYKVDTTMIIGGGVGTGGYITYGAASLDKPAELSLTKFISGTTGQPYVNQAVSGNFDGTNNAPLNIANHVGYGSKINFAFNLGGALGDSTWLEAGDAPMVGFHCPSDPFAPYEYGAVIVPTTGDFVVNVSGTYGAIRRANRLGNNANMAAMVAGLTDPYTVHANSLNNGNEGMFPIITPPPGAPLACPSGNLNQIPQGSPWDWWNETWYIAAANAAGQPGAEVACRAKLGNPDMSGTKGRIYLDSVMQYLNPRIVGALGLNTVGVEVPVNKNVKIFPNPAQNMMFMRSTDGQMILGIELYDATGRLVRVEKDLFTEEFILHRNGLPTGMYIAKLKFKGSEGIGKVWFQ